jgi:hypothetical protein
VIDRFDVVHVQLFGQFVGVDSITLAAIFEQCILSRIADLDSRHAGLQQVVQPSGQVPSSKVTRKSPRSPSMNCRIVLAFVSMTFSITTLPTEFLTQIEMLSLCTSSPIYLTLVIKGCSFLEKFEQRTQNVLQLWLPFLSGHFEKEVQG